MGSVIGGSSMASVLEETSADRGGVAGTGVLLRQSRKCLLRVIRLHLSAVSSVAVSLIAEIPFADFSVYFFLRDRSPIRGIHLVTSGALLSLDGMIPKKQVSPCLRERNKTKWKL